MRVVRWAVPVVAVAAVVAALLLAARSGTIHLPTIGRHIGATVSQAPPPVSVPRVVFDPRDLTHRMASARPSVLATAAVAGWVLSLLLIVLLIRLVGKWRTAFESKEWL